MTRKGNAWAVPLRESASIDTSIPKTDGRPSVHPGKDKKILHADSARRFFMDARHGLKCDGM